MTGSSREVAVDVLLQDALIEVDIGIGTTKSEVKWLEVPDGVNDSFLDGPACRRMAVVDFDPATALPLPPPATLKPPKRGVQHGRYDADQAKPSSPATLAVNAFGTAYLTTKMFEGPDALGRQVEWAFEGEQLLIVPRAGEWANAFYDRTTRSLQFFWFPSDVDGSTIYTALSRDIVAHECGHALLDAVVPSLYDSSTRESIAIHEAIADVVAILMSLDSKALRSFVLANSDNNLAGKNAFSQIAGEFGTARLGEDGVTRSALRELKNTETRETLRNASPHDLSTLLSGIFYDTAESIFAKRLASASKQLANPAAAANRALGGTYYIFRRVVLRAIDYLPPGELTFADVGRATLAADRAALPDSDLPDTDDRKQAHDIRADFAQRFVTRLLIAKAGDLDVEVPRELNVTPAEVVTLHGSDFAAYRWVEEHRTAIGVPRDVPFTVLPRVDATKSRGGDLTDQRELILKVAWSVSEPATVEGLPPKSRLVPTGATVSILWDTGRCLALVTSEITARQHTESRDRLAAQLIADGWADGPVVPGRFRLDTSGDVITMTGSHRLLHLEGWGE